MARRSCASLVERVSPRSIFNGWKKEVFSFPAVRYFYSSLGLRDFLPRTSFEAPPAHLREKTLQFVEATHTRQKAKIPSRRHIGSGSAWDWNADVSASVERGTKTNVLPSLVCKSNLIACKFDLKLRGA
jgi:hypothetical protein